MCKRLVIQLTRWYAKPPGEVGQKFTSCLAEDWRGLCDMIWNSERPFVFDHGISKKTPGARQEKETWKSISRNMDLW